MIKPNRLTTILTLLLLLTTLLTPSFCSATGNYSQTYQLLNRPGSSTYYSLTVSITPSLYGYYLGKDHSVDSYEDLTKFVTPNALRPIADDLWEIYNDEEDFANGVLMIVHQIPYKEVEPEKYPVETIAENEGDCDLFSFIAASIMKAGGLDVVLLIYEEQQHMNIGVYLTNPPDDARFTVHYFPYHGKRYYVAECTGDNWENGWRVGEYPEEFKGASATIIPIENYEQTSPGQVSSSYSSLASSSLTLKLSSNFALVQGTVTIGGSVSPASSDKNVTIYVSSDGFTWNILGVAVTDSNGHYSYAWKPRSAGIYHIMASWSGDQEHAGADSAVCTITVIPIEWLMVGIMGIALLILCAIISARTRREQAAEPPLLPEAETTEF
jgi:hypothetical protein